MNPRRPGPLNRILLTLLGLACLAAGGLTVAAGLGALGRERMRMPVLSAATLDRMAASEWPGYAAAAAAVMLGLAAGCWLAAQRPRERFVVTLAPEAGVRAGTFADAVDTVVRANGSARTEGIDIAGRPDRRLLAVTVVPGPASDLHGLRLRLVCESAAELGKILESDPPATQVLFVTSRGSHTAGRIR